MKLIKFGPDAPGYLRRERKRQEYINADDKEKVFAFIEWLAEYVEGGISAIEEASEAEVNELIQSFTAAEEPDPKA